MSVYEREGPRANVHIRADGSAEVWLAPGGSGAPVDFDQSAWTPVGATTEEGFDFRPESQPLSEETLRALQETITGQIQATIQEPPPTLMEESSDIRSQVSQYYRQMIRAREEQLRHSIDIVCRREDEERVREMAPGMRISTSVHVPEGQFYVFNRDTGQQFLPPDYYFQAPRPQWRGFEAQIVAVDESVAVQEAKLARDPHDFSNIDEALRCFNWESCGREDLGSGWCSDECHELFLEQKWGKLHERPTARPDPALSFASDGPIEGTIRSPYVAGYSTEEITQLGISPDLLENASMYLRTQHHNVIQVEWEYSLDALQVEAAVIVRVRDDTFVSGYRIVRLIHAFSVEQLRTMRTEVVSLALSQKVASFLAINTSIRAARHPHGI